MRKSSRLAFPPSCQPTRILDRHNATASPTASAATTDDVGAGRALSASSVAFSPLFASGVGTLRPVPASSHPLQAWARIESASRVMAMRFLTRLRTTGMSRINSAVAPEWEMRSRASQGEWGEQGQMTPRSPWSASSGWRKTAGAPGINVSSAIGSIDRVSSSRVA